MPDKIVAFNWIFLGFEEEEDLFFKKKKQLNFVFLSKEHLELNINNFLVLLSMPQYINPLEASGLW
jgi:hypothetical protein